MPDISTKPYLLRAIYEWCTDSGYTPYLAVKVDAAWNQFGGGLTAAILGKELAEAGQRVVALERGPMRDTVPDFQSPTMHDELKFDVRYALIQDLSAQTVTFRNFAGQRALPMRQLGSFLPGDGVGGAAVHWNGQTWRFQPEWFRLRSWVNEIGRAHV